MYTRAVKTECRLLVSNASWYRHCLTIYISVIRFLHSTYLRIFRWNDVTYWRTHAVCITMVTWKQHSCNLSGSSLKTGGYTSPVKRICVFEHSVITNFNCACPAIQRGQRSGFLSEGSSWLTAFISEQRRSWRDCADAQARLNLRCSHKQ